jgi:hypothetical protein
MESIQTKPVIPPLRIRVEEAARLSGLSVASIRKAISEKLFKSQVYFIGRGRNRVRLIDFASFQAFLNNLPEGLGE